MLGTFLHTKHAQCALSGASSYHSAAWHWASQYCEFVIVEYGIDWTGDGDEWLSLPKTRLVTDFDRVV